MAEDQELRLVVTVDDRASAQIERLQSTLRSMGSGSQAAGMERTKRQTGEIGASAAQAAQQMRGLAISAGVVGGVVGGLTARFAGAAGEFLGNVTNLRAYTSQVQELGQRSHDAGLSMAQYKANVAVFREVGVSAEQAGRNIQNLGDTQSDLLLANSRVRQEMMAGMAPNRIAEMDARLQEIAQSDRQRALTLTRDMLRDIRREWTAAEGPETGALMERRAAAAMGVPDLAKTRGVFGAITAEQEAMWDKRDAEAAKFESLTEKTEGSLKRATTAIQGALFAALPINETMEGILTRTIAWGESMEEVEKFFRLSRIEQERMLQAKAQTYFEGLTPRGKELAKTATGDVPETEGQMKFNRLINTWLEKLGIKPGDPALKKVSETVREGAEEFPDWLLGKLGPEAQWAFGPQRPTPAVREGALEPEPPIPSILRKPPPLEAKPITGPEVKVPVPALGPSPLLLEPPTPPSILRRPPPPKPESPEIVLQQTPPPPTVPVVAQPQAPVTQPMVPPTVMVQPQPAQPEPQPPALPSVLRTDRPPPPEARQIVLPQPEPPALPPVRLLPPQPKPPEPSFEQRFGEWPQPKLVEPEPPTRRAVSLLQPTRPLPEAQPIIVPPMPAVTTRPQVEPRPSVLRLPTPQMPWEPKAEDSSDAAMPWMRSLPDVRSLAPQRVDVNGTGTIKVDVNAPPGTHVGAEASGLFKSTEIMRQTQMMPASWGPLPATGMGAGE